MIHQRRMRELLQSFADGELSEARRAWMERHLSHCAACAASLRRLQESDRLLGAARPAAPALTAEASRALLARVVAEAGSAPRTLWPASPPFSWAFSAALVVTAGASVAWWALPGHGPGGGPAGMASGTASMGTLVANTWGPMGAGGAVRKMEGGSRAAKAPRAVPGSGALTKGKKESPTASPAGPAAPRDGLPLRRHRSPRLRYVCRKPDEPGAAGTPTRLARQESDEPSGVELVSGPLPASFLDPVAGIAGPRTVAGGLAPGQMLVLVTPERAPSPVTVTCASPEAPGFARASALRPDGVGGWLWTEATVQSECAGPEQSLVILGSSALPWEEEKDERVWGQTDEESGNGGDAAARAGSEPAVDPGSGAVSPPDEVDSGDVSEPECFVDGHGDSPGTGDSGS